MNYQQAAYYITAVCLSTMALAVTFRNYRRKSGVYVRGNFSIGSSIYCNDSYITHVILENLKDRAVTIFGIYLKVGHNFYIEVEDLEGKPLILRPYETYKKEFGPIEFYGINTNKISMNTLLKDTKVKKQLVLSTSDGKYKVPTNLRRWNPVWEFFQNHMTAVVRPVQSQFKEIGIGGNIKYVLEIMGENNKEEIIPIHPGDYQIKKFRDFNLTKEALESKEALELFLEGQVQIGKLSCKKYVVHDLRAWRERVHEFYTGETINAESVNWFQYRILGTVFTKYSDWKLKRENAKRSQLHKSQAGGKTNT